MNNLEKLTKILSDKKSTWEEEARLRQKNEDWLSQSFDIAVRVLDVLREKKMTQKDLAEKMDVSPQFINKVIKGRENLSLETIGKLSRALGIKLIEVVEPAAKAEVTYSVEQAYEASERYRREIFKRTTSKDFVGLEATLHYVKEQKLEYKMPA